MPQFMKNQIAKILCHRNKYLLSNKTMKFSNFPNNNPLSIIFFISFGYNLSL